jgi:hypothetical protein
MNRERRIESLEKKIPVKEKSYSVFLTDQARMKLIKAVSGNPGAEYNDFIRFPFCYDEILSIRAGLFKKYGRNYFGAETFDELKRTAQNEK